MVELAFRLTHCVSASLLNKLMINMQILSFLMGKFCGRLRIAASSGSDLNPIKGDNQAELRSFFQNSMNLPSASFKIPVLSHHNAPRESKKFCSTENF